MTDRLAAYAAATTIEDDEITLNDEVIAELANETCQPLAVVREIYEQVFARLKANARIHDYVLLFARRQTRDALARRRS